ncbi:hypothetical protein BXZ70DRAFT_910964 [Cristinia sonorae]|uniref:Uncharacterized protein n=1 Tax=Cristinia sonorae TaxID=1940300 RepID=A0A8K0UE89_9AGAR|nr:hypothetical protein BXZ70DRAFT_910964 [Cristinia sonorae]
MASIVISLSQQARSVFSRAQSIRTGGTKDKGKGAVLPQLYGFSSEYTQSVGILFTLVAKPEVQCLASSSLLTSSNILGSSLMSLPDWSSRIPLVTLSTRLALPNVFISIPTPAMYGQGFPNIPHLASCYSGRIKTLRVFAGRLQHVHTRSTSQEAIQEGPRTVSQVTLPYGMVLPKLPNSDHRVRLALNLIEFQRSGSQGRKDDRKVYAHQEIVMWILQSTSCTPFPTYHLQTVIATPDFLSFNGRPLPSRAAPIHPWSGNPTSSRVLPSLIAQSTRAHSASSSFVKAARRGCTLNSTHTDHQTQESPATLTLPDDIHCCQDRGSCVEEVVHWSAETLAHSSGNPPTSSVGVTARRQFLGVVIIRIHHPNLQLRRFCSDPCVQGDPKAKTLHVHVAPSCTTLITIAYDFLKAVIDLWASSHRCGFQVEWRTDVRQVGSPHHEFRTGKIVMGTAHVPLARHRAVAWLPPRRVIGGSFAISILSAVVIFSPEILARSAFIRKMWSMSTDPERTGEGDLGARLSIDTRQQARRYLRGRRSKDPPISSPQVEDTEPERYNAKHNRSPVINRDFVACTYPIVCPLRDHLVSINSDVSGV